MSEFAIRARGLGKRYRVGTSERYTALRDELARLPRAIMTSIGRSLSPRARAQGARATYGPSKTSIWKSVRAKSWVSLGATVLVRARC